MDNKTIYNCDKCSKKYKSKTSLDNHKSKCSGKDSVSSPKPTKSMKQAPKAKQAPEAKQAPKENNYDVNMTFLKDNQVKVEVKNTNDSDSDSDNEDPTAEGMKALREIIKPDVCESYQEEIDKLEDMIEIFSNLPIPKKTADQAETIEQLKSIIAIVLTQSQNLIKEMKQMSKRNSYYKNNIMLAAFILDKCRRDIPDSNEEFDNMFT